ncbi:hypothetical protein E8E13_009940 [Curvularia kusanoi]|uniref:Nucleoside phosphorylase domain-containing protein n=1 Tax=Curvularia kusanoi TaxID=90978 RepID=A0A9P4TGW5_CURKU|nr:hypothetical protein E8E13_009940 [Curvularia kusanoi]
MPRRLRREDYTVGWVCALPVELAAAKLMLDETHEDAIRTDSSNDENIYSMGSVAGHNVVIGCLPAGRIGTNPAATVATQMQAAFKNIRFGLMVGIGGGVPSAADIRLGDVVVSQPDGSFGGVVQYDLGKATTTGFRRMGTLNTPPQILLSALSTIQAEEMMGRSNLTTYLMELEEVPIFRRSKAGTDILFQAVYDHVGGPSCGDCRTESQQSRPSREEGEEIIVHYGTIASGNQVIKNATERDRISADLGSVFCFEMEAAGLMNSFPCLVIRGICDYSDSHKNSRWQPYAAGTAAAYAKGLLKVIPAAEVLRTGRVEEVTSAASKRGFEPSSPERPSQKRTRIEISRNPGSVSAEPLTQGLLDDHHGFLWIKGKAGTGKSTLMKFASANARKKKMKNETVLSFFFNARGEDLEKSTIGAYRSLLLQLVEGLPALQVIFNYLSPSILSLNVDHQWNMETLKELFEYAVQNLGDASVLCFVDALDECDEEQVRNMIQFFEQIGDLVVSKGIRFRVCFSSRHYPNITIRKGLTLVLEGSEGHSEDIANYIETELKIGKSKSAQQIRMDVQEKASGIFMWVVLVVGILNTEFDRGKVHVLRQKLRVIPSDLHELFRDILTRDANDREELVLCIQWILFAKQPLSPEQLYHAVYAGTDPKAISEWNSDDMTREVASLFVLGSSKGFAEVTKSKQPKVQFIHESVRDFLLKDNGLSRIWPELEHNFQGQSHDRLKQCCINYISNFTIVEHPTDLNDESWHAAEGGGVSQADFLTNFPSNHWVRVNNLYEKHNIRKHSNDVSLLYLLAEYNMANLIGIFGSVDCCTNLEGSRYGCPLLAAVAKGNEEILERFMDSIKASEIHGISTIALITHDEWDKTYQHRGRLDFEYKKSKPLFENAAAIGHDKLLALLAASKKIQLNPDTMIKGGRYGTALQAASAIGFYGNVEKLLNEGADINAKGGEYGSALQAAQRKGFQNIVELLENKASKVSGSTRKEIATPDRTVPAQSLPDRGRGIGTREQATASRGRNSAVETMRISNLLN